MSEKPQALRHKHHSGPVSVRRLRWTFCHTMKKEEAHLSPASICFLDGKQRPVHAAHPIPSSHQLPLPLLNKIHTVPW